MGQTIDYYYSHLSPWAFLGHARLLEIAEKTGAEIAFYPITTAEIFPKTGGLPLAKRPPERRAYRMVELKRWSRHLGIEMNFEPKFFPADDRPALHMAVAAQEAGADLGAFSYSVMKAIWQEERDPADPGILLEIAEANGLNGGVLAGIAQTDAVAAKAQANCDAALMAGCFGVPWYVLNGEPFWGQDRLILLEEALTKGG